MGGNLWSTYVRAVSGGVTQREVAEKVGVISQPTVSRWMNDGPQQADVGNIAAFCNAYDRDPIEGFVAAGLLTEEQAGRSLKPKQRTFLRELRAAHDLAQERARRERDTPKDAGGVA